MEKWVLKISYFDNGWMKPHSVRVFNTRQAALFFMNRVNENNSTGYNRTEKTFYVSSPPILEKFTNIGGDDTWTLKEYYERKILGN